MSEVVITIPRPSWRMVAVGLVTVVVVVVFGVPPVRDAIASSWEPRRTAAPAAIADQRAGLERALGRTYASAVKQIDDASRLTLPISAVEAAAIVRRYTDELRAIRRDALAASAQRYGLEQREVAAYVAEAEARLDVGVDPSAPAVLLAPPLYDIVARAAQLSAAKSDEGVRELTRSRASPGPSPSPTARP